MPAFFLVIGTKEIIGQKDKKRVSTRHRRSVEHVLVRTAFLR
jgi:hypothetical protein